MPAESIVFAGLELRSGRKPVTFISLDDELNVQPPQRWDISEALACLGDYESVWLAVSLSSRAREAEQDLTQQIRQTGYAPYPRQSGSRQLLITNAQACFQALIGQRPLPRRTLEGRLQRSAVLYEQGLQIRDPVEIFEEITRYRLVQGILPLEDIYSSKELDALVAAYVAWLAATSPGQTQVQGDFVLPVTE